MSTGLKASSWAPRAALREARGEAVEVVEVVRAGVGAASSAARGLEHQAQVVELADVPLGDPHHRGPPPGRMVTSCSWARISSASRTGPAAHAQLRRELLLDQAHPAGELRRSGWPGAGCPPRAGAAPARPRGRGAGASAAPAARSGCASLLAPTGAPPSPPALRPLCACAGPTALLSLRSCQQEWHDGGSAGRRSGAPRRRPPTPARGAPRDDDASHLPGGRHSPITAPLRCAGHLDRARLRRRRPEAPGPAGAPDRPAGWRRPPLLLRLRGPVRDRRLERTASLLAPPRGRRPRARRSARWCWRTRPTGLVVTWEATTYADPGGGDLGGHLPQRGPGRHPHPGAGARPATSVAATDCYDLQVYYATGGHATPDAFAPQVRSLRSEPAGPFRLASLGGRSSNGVLPYFSVETNWGAPERAAGGRSAGAGSGRP